MNYQFIAKSKNRKIGPMAATNSHRGTCPTACPLVGKGGCYAEAGFHTRLNWDKLDEGTRGGTWDALLHKVAALPEGSLWRHNVSGDLPPSADNTIDADAVADLVRANEGRRGFTYTHYPLTEHNEQVIRDANEGGFSINVSANTIADAVGYHKRKLPTVTLVSKVDHGDRWIELSHDEVTVVQCPAEYRDTSCAKCTLCQKSNRRFVIGFTVHGTQAKNADLIAKS